MRFSGLVVCKNVVSQESKVNEWKKTTKHMNKLKIQECQIFQVQPVYGECKITRAQVNNSSITQLHKNTLSGDDIL